MLSTAVCGLVEFRDASGKQFLCHGPVEASEQKELRRGVIRSDIIVTDISDRNGGHRSDDFSI